MTSHRRLVAAAALSVIISGCSSAAPAEETSTSTSTTATTFAPLTTIDGTAAAASSTTTTSSVPVAPPPPRIEVDPPTGSVVDAYRVDFTVKTDPGLLVLVDGEAVTLDEDGVAVVTRASTPGANAIVVAVSDGEGKTYTYRSTYLFEPKDGWIALVGDSIMRGAEEEIELRIGPRTVDAVDGRQFWEGAAAVRDVARSRNPPELLVIHLGTNGQVTADHFDRIMRASEGVRDVVFVNLSVPRRWEEANNLELEASVERYDNASLVDWQSFLVTHADRDALLKDDGVHLNEVGWVVYAEFLTDALFPDWLVTVP